MAVGHVEINQVGENDPPLLAGENCLHRLVESVFIALGVHGFGQTLSREEVFDLADPVNG